MPPEYDVAFSRIKRQLSKLSDVDRLLQNARKIFFVQNMFVDSEEYDILRFMISECMKDITHDNIDSDIESVLKLGFADALKFNCVIAECISSTTKCIDVFGIIIDKLQNASRGVSTYSRGEYDRDWEYFCGLELDRLKKADTVLHYSKIKS